MRVRLVVGHPAAAEPASGRQVACAFQLAPPESRAAPVKGAILVVAGGSDTCAEAATLACDQFYASPSHYPVEALRQALIAVRSAVPQPRDRETPLMPVYLMCAAVGRERLILGCLGEGGSAYLWHGGKLAPLTYDDSFAVGGEPTGRASEPEVDAVATLAEGDRLLLCTRGVYGRVDQEALVAGLTEGTPQVACDKLTALAQEAGDGEGPAIVVAEVHLEEEAEEGAPQVPALRDAEVDEAVRDEEIPDWLAPQPELDWRRQALAERERDLGRRERHLQEAESDLSEREEALRAGEAVLSEREEELRRRERQQQEAEGGLSQREEALRAAEAALAERDRQTRKLEAALEAREQALLAEEASASSQALEPAGELSTAKLMAESLISGQAGLVGHLQELGRGYERLGMAIRQLSAQTAAVEEGQEAVQAELDGQRQELLRWAGQLGEYEESLRGWQERLALAEEANLLLQAPPEAALRYEWHKDLEFSAALAAGGAQEQATVELPDGRSVLCGLTVRREYIRRQYPMAVEVWAQAGEETAGRLLVGYGLDVRTMPADLLRERSLAVVIGGGEAFALAVGGIAVHAVITHCEFATPAAHRVSRDHTAFLSLGVTFRVVVDADARQEPPALALGPGSIA